LSAPRVDNQNGASSEPTVPPMAAGPDPKLLPAPTQLDPAPVSAADPKFKLRGRIETDSITVTQSQKDKAIYGDFQNATGFRRARIGAGGTAGEQVYWESEFDFAGGIVAFKNVFIGIKKLPIVGEFRVGHMLEPFSLEGQISSRFFPFV